MKTRTLLSTSVVALVVLTLTSAMFAQNGNPARKNRRQEIAKHLASKLNLTDQQKQQIKALREQFRSENAGTLSEVKALRDQVREAIKNKDKAAAKAALEQLKAKMQTLKPAREQLRQKVGQVLTPEQRDMLEKMRQDRKQHREDRREKWRDQHGKQGGTQRTPDGGIN